MSDKPTVIHVTHEAIGKIGGIGAVLHGLLTSKSYLETVERSILISPMFTREGNRYTRLGDDSEVLYSSMDGVYNTNFSRSLQKLEEFFGISIIYGTKTFTDVETGISSSPEILLFDIGDMDTETVDELKGKMYKEFGIQSNRYEDIWEFEQYVRIAPPAIQTLNMLGAAGQDNPSIIIAHEFMGMPTALAGKLDPSHDFKTVFYAHEVAPMRQLVEKNSGHDTMFYNVMKKAREIGLNVHEVFGDQNHFFKSSLVEAAKHCDNILAVGDYVVDELKFLAHEFEHADIDLTYNGIPAYKITLDDKHTSRGRLKEYCNNLLGFKPDFIFSHVTRMAISKGLWRDLRVLEHMDREFETQNKTGVLFVLSTQVAKRSNKDICQMESTYNWPVAHREGWPDMNGGEAAFYEGVQEFNAKSRNIKVVYINQFGFDRESCGHRMPADMEFMDIREGCDVEFGQSIYEPFGIAQLESLSFGGICVITNICGCAGFVKEVTGGKDSKNVIIADYTEIDNYEQSDIEDLKAINKDFRDNVEHKLSEKIALEICARLPKTNKEFLELIDSGYEIAKHMGWNAVCQKYVLKSLHKAMHKQHDKNFALWW